MKKEAEPLTVRHLQIFITVYQKENITRAAESLHMTQPTVTRAIQELEEHYSRRLFERIHRRLYVTEAGRQLYRQAVQVIAALDRMEENMKEWGETGTLRGGAGTTLGCVLLPHVAAGFQKRHPRLSIRSTVTDRDRLQRMLLHNEIDCALIEGAPDDPGLARLFLGTDRMVLILPADHPLCARETLSIPDLKGQAVVVSETGSASRNYLEHLFSLHGMKLEPVMESRSIPAIIQAVRAGVGIALMPRKMLALYGAESAIAERDLPYEVLRRENYLVWHENRYISPAFLEFTDYVKECAGDILS